MNGKKCDVLIEDIWFPNKDGEEKLSSMITVWADKGKLDIIKSVEGVTNAYAPISESQYDVFLDPRYDHEFLKEEIKAAILIDR